MRNTFSYNFICRSSKANRKGLSPVELSFNCNGQRLYLNLPFRCKAEEFNKKKRPQDIQDYLDVQRVTINKVLTDLAENGIPVTAANLRTYFRTGGVKPYTIEDLFNDYLLIQKERIGKTLSKSVYRKYELVTELFYTLVDKTQEVMTINNALIRRYFALLDGKYDNSTSCGYKTKIKAIITFGMDNNKIKINPFQGIKIIREKKEITYLTEEEINLLISTPIENESLSRVRDCAVFQLSSGLAFSDVAALEEGDLQEENGIYFITKDRVKTGTTYCSVVLPEGVEVYKKYGGHIPLISNQKFNAYLKSIQTLCGIKTSLHSHLFRHTYATRLLNKGVNMKTVSRTLGHSNSKVTENFYAHLEDRTILKEVSTAINK